MMQVQQGLVSFGPISQSGPQDITTTVTMPSPKSQATAILTGIVL